MVIENLPGIASSISALAAIAAVFMSARNARKIQEVHISINSRMDQLLEAKGEASEAKGLERGRSEAIEQPPIKVDIVKLPQDMPKA